MRRLARSGDSTRRGRGFARSKEQESSLSYELTIRQEPEFLHVIVTGKQQAKRDPLPRGSAARVHCPRLCACAD